MLGLVLLENSENADWYFYWKIQRILTGFTEKFREY